MNFISKWIAGAALVLSASAFAADVFPAKAAELSCHRIDRLVTLGKIDGAFLSRLETLEIRAPDKDAPSGTMYMTVASQTEPTQGGPLQLKLYLDNAGKVLNKDGTIVPGGVAGSDPQWPDKDPITLSENSLHYILENGEINNEIEPFLKSFVSLKLAKGTLDGAPVSEATVLSSATTKKMKVYLNMAGEFQSFQIIQ